MNQLTPAHKPLTITCLFLMEPIKTFTLSVFTENNIGLLNRLTIIFTRRKINIESLTTSESEISNVHRFTIVVRCTRDMVEKLVKQIEKQIEVIRAFYYDETDVIYQEIALYKVSTEQLQNGNGIEKLVRDNNARILSAKPGFIVIEKTGHEYETQGLFEKLRPYGVLQFARSGRIAVSESIQNISGMLREFEAANP